MDSVTPETIYHNKTGNTTAMFFCYRTNMTTSAGAFVGDDPLDYSFPLFLYQIVTIFIITHVVHAILRRLSLPLVISQIIGGLLLGPSFLGRNKAFESLFFKPQGWEQLNTLAYFSYTLFLFIMGVKTDIGMISKSGKKAVAVAILGTGLPHIFFLIYAKINSEHLKILFADNFNLYNVALRWSMTSYVVLSCALGELHLLTSKLGRIAMAASLLADFINTFVSSFLQAILFEEGGGFITSIYSFLTFLGISIAIVVIAQVFVVWLIHQPPESRFLDETRLVIILMIALASGLATEVTGYHGLGAFMFGLVLPGGAPLGVTVMERLDRLVTGIFLPVFIAMAGIRMDLTELVVDVPRWGFFQAFVSVSVVGKFIGAVLPCLYFGMQWKDALILGLLMNFKGIREVDFTAQWQDSKIVDNQEYTILMSSVIFLGGATAVLVRNLYRPEDRFVAYKRRTIHHSKPGDELRIISCVHSQSDVSLTLSLLDASYPTPSSPLCVYLINLMELAGRTDAILRPHKEKSSRRPSKINSSTAHSDRIVNAFNIFERQRPTGAVSIMPFVCISPYNTMHEDICSLALDKKAVLVLIPFHQRYHADGTAEPPNLSILTVNLNVLSYAPCSVGILIDRGGSTARDNHQIAMYFIGGPDDREALALATRMADNPKVGLTVVRFRESYERHLRSSRVWKENDDAKIDEEIVEEFVRETVDNQRVIYREEVVRSGEELVSVIRETSSMFSLLIVGRREVKDKAKESGSLMEGMSEWSEHPELGVIGDLLVSRDFGCMVPTLVVQQQTMVGNFVPQSDAQVTPLPDAEP